MEAQATASPPRTSSGGVGGRQQRLVQPAAGSTTWNEAPSLLVSTSTTCADLACSRGQPRLRCPGSFQPIGKRMIWVRGVVRQSTFCAGGAEILGRRPYRRTRQAVLSRGRASASSAGRPSTVSADHEDRAPSAWNSQVRKRESRRRDPCSEINPLLGARQAGASGRMELEHVVEEIWGSAPAVSGRGAPPRSPDSDPECLEHQVERRGAVSVPFPHSGQRLRRSPQCPHGSPAFTVNLLPFVAAQ